MQLEISIEKLADFADPMHDDVWGVGIITPLDVQLCEDVSPGQFYAGYEGRALALEEDKAFARACHIARIRWFMDHGTPELDAHPITVDVLSDYDIRIVDGNHRFAAAMCAGFKTITVEIAGYEEIAETALVPDSRA